LVSTNDSFDRLIDVYGCGSLLCSDIVHRMAAEVKRGVGNPSTSLTDGSSSSGVSSSAAAASGSSASSSSSSLLSSMGRGRELKVDELRAAYAR
jgi:hypothetical protein